MEPPINYGNMGIPQTPGEGPKVYGRSKFKGCAIIGSLVLIIILGGAGYLIYKGVSTAKDIYDVTQHKSPFDNKNSTDNKNSDSRFEGATFMDAVVIPQNGGNPKIWILTDASKTAIVTHKRPGQYSTGSECIDCRTRAFIYETGTDKILNKTDNPFNDLVTESNIFGVNGKILQFTHGYHDALPRINIYDANTGSMLSETKDFIDMHEELKSGIVSLSYSNYSQTISFDTKDGQKNLIYSPVTDKIYTNESKLSEDIAAGTPDGTGIACGLKSATKDKRYKLWKVTAPRKNLITKRSTYISYIGEQRTLDVFAPDAKTELVSDKIYLQGIIYYQDEDIAVIIYVDQAGKTANRIMTCVDLHSGNEKWTVNPDGLFSFMKIDENQKTDSGFDYTKDRIKIRKSGNILALTFLGGGIMGFDSESGKKLWTLEIH